MTGKRLQAKEIQTLPVPARGGKIFYDHGSTPGFGVRVTAAGHRAFILNYRTRAGRERRLTIGAPPVWTLMAARIEAAELRRRIDIGEDPLQARTEARQAPSMADLADRFILEHLPSLRPGTQAGYRQHIASTILPALGHLKVADVRGEDIDRLHRRGRSPVHANRCVAVLSKMMTMAIRLRWRSENPCRGVARNQEEKRARYLSEAELPVLLAAIDGYKDRCAAKALQFLLLTGARSGETLSATWSQFDIETGVWSKPSAATKQKRLHRVPLSGAAVELLRAIGPHDPSALVFPIGRTGLRNAWVAICADAGISGLRVHDLRHSFASMLVNSGLSLPVIGALLGHTVPATTARYSHLADHAMREATERVGIIVAKAGKVGS